MNNLCFFFDFRGCFALVGRDFVFVLFLEIFEGSFSFFIFGRVLGMYSAVLLAISVLSF